MLTSGAVLAVIPARGGSKGLPGKNLRPLAGLPLVAHSIECARRVPEIDCVVVSTDSEEIADVARGHGAEVPFMRPAALATDEAGLDPVLRHAHDEMERRAGHEFGVHVLLQPTTPVRRPEDVSAGLALLDADPDADGVVACSQPAWNPFYVGAIERDGWLTVAFEHARAIDRRQAAPEYLRINGALYAWRRRWLARRDPHWLDARHRALRIADRHAVDIDAAEDFEFVEWLISSGRVRLPWLGRA